MTQVCRATSDLGGGSATGHSTWAAPAGPLPGQGI